MSTSTSLRTALLSVLALDKRHLIDEIITHIERRIATNDLTPEPITTGNVRVVQLNSRALVSFEHAQIGDLRIDEIVGGDKIEIKIQLPDRPSRPDLDVELLADPKPLYGRAKDLEQTRLLLEERSFVAITGGPGVGKSALATFLVHQIAPREQILWCELPPRGGFAILVSKIAAFLASRDDWTVYDTFSELLKGQSILTSADNLINQIAAQLRGLKVPIYLSYEEVTEENTAGEDDDGPLHRLGKRLRRLAKEGSIKLVIAAQDPPSFINEDEAYKLENLDRNAIGAMLIGMGLSAELADDLALATEGTPLFLVLGIEGLRTGKLTRAALVRLAETPRARLELSRRMYDGLDNAEKLVMQGLALLDGYPGTADALGAMVEIPDLRLVIDRLYRRSLVLMSSDADYVFQAYTQHRVVRDYCAAQTSRGWRLDALKRAGAYTITRGQALSLDGKHQRAVAALEHGFALLPPDTGNELRITGALVLSALAF